jgi:hypothetical protein
MVTDKRGAKRAGRIHRGATDRGCPQTGKNDVPGYSERGIGADVSGTGRSPKNHAHKSRRQDSFNQRGCPGADAWARCRGAEVADVGEREAQEASGKDAADYLSAEIARNPLPRKVPAQGEPDGDGRIQVGPANGSHEIDDSHDHQARSDYLRIKGHAPVALGVDNRGASSHEDEQKGTKGLREETAPLICQVVEISGPWCL